MGTFTIFFMNFNNEHSTNRKHRIPYLTNSSPIIQTLIKSSANFPYKTHHDDLIRRSLQSFSIDRNDPRAHSAPVNRRINRE